MTGKKKYVWDGSELGWNGDILSSMMRCLNTDKIEIREKREGRQWERDEYFVTIEHHMLYNKSWVLEVVFIFALQQVPILIN